MDKETLYIKCLDIYKNRLSLHEKMKKYYVGNTDAMAEYKFLTDRSNNKTKCNFIKKFIKEETSYLLGNKITYISRSSQETIIKDIAYNLAHWSEKHDQNLLKNSLIHGESYELYFVDKDGFFNSRILTPLNSFVLTDDVGNIELALHVFEKRFEDTKYVDVYLKNEVIHYKLVTGDSMLDLIGRDPHIFDEVPFGICSIAEEKELDTLYADLKGLQDAYETNLSDISNEISDFRSAYLTITGADIEEEDVKKMKQLGVMMVPKEGIVQWLIKNINDGFIQNTLKNIEDKIYQISGHINANEKLSSNTSSLALRTRLISLENKCSLNADAVTDCVKTRLKFLFKYLKIKQDKSYDYRDISSKYTPNIPQDDLMMAQIVSQLGEKLSTETGLAQLSFIDNPKEEIKKIQKEQENMLSGQTILDMMDDEGNSNGVE